VTVLESSGIAPGRLEQVREALAKERFDVVTLVQHQP